MARPSAAARRRDGALALAESVVIAKALAHPARQRMLALAARAEVCACHFTAILGLAPPTVSAHLRELRLAGLVEERREGRWVFVRLAGSGEARRWALFVLGALADTGPLTEDRRALDELLTVPLEELCRDGSRRSAGGARRCKTPNSAPASSKSAGTRAKRRRAGS